MIGLMETVEKVEQDMDRKGHDILLRAWMYLRWDRPITPELRDAWSILRDRWLDLEPTFKRKF